MPSRHNKRTLLWASFWCLLAVVGIALRVDVALIMGAIICSTVWIATG